MYKIIEYLDGLPYLKDFRLKLGRTTRLSGGEFFGLRESSEKTLLLRPNLNETSADRGLAEPVQKRKLERSINWEEGPM